MNTLEKLFEQQVPNVIQEISPHDNMYQGENREHYYGVGQSALKCIKLAILAAGKNFADIGNILDLPSGYGRVLRFLKAFFREAQITACDIEQDAVDFCAKVFDAKPVYSKKRPADIENMNRFDLVWCGSLFTHLNFYRWAEFLNFFSSVLNNNGILVFTVHGRYCAERIRTGNFTYGLDDVSLKMLLKGFDRNGSCYVNYSNTEDYGISLSVPSHVLTLLEKLSDFQLLLYLEKGWDNHHDVVACMKI
jgi:SAM-dependent methyltransferase